jgi:FAD/FMN-containing dehydrogenase
MAGGIASSAGAVVLPRLAEEVQDVVRTRAKYRIPFVAGCGEGIIRRSLADAQGVVIGSARMSLLRRASAPLAATWQRTREARIA